MAYKHTANVIKENPFETQEKCTRCIIQEDDIKCMHSIHSLALQLLIARLVLRRHVIHWRVLCALLFRMFFYIVSCSLERLHTLPS